MQENANNPRRHPDIFNSEDAAVYLYLDCVATLDTIRRDFGLVGFKVGKVMMFHRKDLDAVTERMFRVGPAAASREGTPKLKLSGSRT